MNESRKSQWAGQERSRMLFCAIVSRARCHVAPCTLRQQCYNTGFHPGLNSSFWTVAPLA